MPDLVTTLIWPPLNSPYSASKLFVRMRNSAIESRLGIIAAPMFTSSSTSLPLTMKAVGKLALAIDGNRPRIQISGGRKRAGADVLHGVRGDRSDRSNSRLKRQQIGVAAAVERNGGHLRAGDDFTDLRARGFDL